MNNKLAQYTAHIILFIGILVMILPIWLTFASSTFKNETIVTEGMKWGIGNQFYTNYNEVLNEMPVPADDDSRTKKVKQLPKEFIKRLEDKTKISS